MPSYRRNTIRWWMTWNFRVQNFSVHFSICCDLLNDKNYVEFRLMFLMERQNSALQLYCSNGFSVLLIQSQCQSNVIKVTPFYVLIAWFVCSKKFCCFWYSGLWELTAVICLWPILVTDSVLCILEDCIIMFSAELSSATPWQSGCKECCTNILTFLCSWSLFPSWLLKQSDTLRQIRSMYVVDIVELKIRRGRNWNILSVSSMCSYRLVKTQSSAAICLHQICLDS